jgi:DNA polymerase-4
VPSDAFGPGLDDTGCSILHVDMDAFFAAVEIAKRPELRGRPIIVGGLGPRGVVSAASYEARPYGVNSAMPMAVARNRCPHAVFLHPDGAAYSRVSKAVMAIFAQYTPLVEPLSVDEAFLDVSGARRLFGSPADIAAAIRAEVAAEHGITCTVGIASTKFIAKLASTQAKPDGLAIVPAAKSLDFLHPLPIAALWGVGEKTATVLKRLGMRTVADIARASRTQLETTIGKAAAAHLHALANGVDPRVVESSKVDKSVGAEVTFDTDVSDMPQLMNTVLRLSQKVAARARKAEVTGRTVAVKIRMSDFVTLSRSRTLREPTDVAHDLYDIAAELVRDNVSGPVRLLGVRLEGLTDSRGKPYQPQLGAPEHGWREVERTVDDLSARFGSRIVGPASLMDGQDRPQRQFFRS